MALLLRQRERRTSSGDGVLEASGLGVSGGQGLHRHHILASGERRGAFGQFYGTRSVSHRFLRRSRQQPREAVEQKWIVGIEVNRKRELFGGRRTFSTRGVRFAEICMRSRVIRIEFKRSLQVINALVEFAERAQDRP